MDQLAQENPSSHMNILWPMERMKMIHGLHQSISSGLMDMMDNKLSYLMTLDPKKSVSPSSSEYSIGTRSKSQLKEVSSIGIQNSFSSPPPTTLIRPLNLEPNIVPKISTNSKGESHASLTFPVQPIGQTSIPCYQPPGMLLSTTIGAINNRQVPVPLLNPWNVPVVSQTQEMQESCSPPQEVSMTLEKIEDTIDLWESFFNDDFDF